VVHVPRGAIEERVSRLNELVAEADAQTLEDYQDRLDISWVHHDSALEGTVHGPAELASALSDQVVSDSSLLPAYDEVRQNKVAIDLVRELAERKRLTINLEVIKKIYGALAPDEVEGKGTPKYRKDSPVHRMYFHEIAPPEKISYRMRQLIQWINSAETKRSTHTVRLAAKAHHTLLQIYPFPKLSGKVARLLMNLILMRSGYPPAIIHATERQRYYEALKTSDNAVANLVNEALGASTESAIRFFEGQELAADTA